MVLITVDVVIKEGAREEFLQHAGKCIQKTREEKENISYQLFSNPEDNCKFTFFEEWETAESLNSHMKTEHYLELTAGMKDLLAKPLVAQSYDAQRK